MNTPGAPTAPAVTSLVRKGDGGDDPAVVDVAAAERSSQK
jgi:hypothetical protein